MDVLKLATDWAKDEIFSTKFFILFGIIFLIASVAFWQSGKTEMAKAFVTPSLVTGLLLLIIGGGLYYSNYQRLKSFPIEYKANVSAFVATEIERAEKTINEFKNTIFKVIPAIIAVCALLLIFVDKPIWRASCLATIAMMVVIMVVDINSNARMEQYHQELLESDV